MFTNITPGTNVTLSITGADNVTGTFVKVTPKTVKVNVDGTDRVIKLDTVAGVMVDEGDALTTAELAVIFNTSAKALRVQLRKLGLGVGKGSRYALPRDAFVATYGDAIRAGLADNA